MPTLTAPVGRDKSQDSDSQNSRVGGTMDLEEALRELYQEKKRLDSAIAHLESRLAMTSEAPKRSTRGRKCMSVEERLVVSARMRSYWAARRRDAPLEEGAPRPAEEPGAPPGKFST